MNSSRKTTKLFGQTWLFVSFALILGLVFLQSPIDLVSSPAFAQDDDRGRKRRPRRGGGLEEVSGIKPRGSESSGGHAAFDDALEENTAVDAVLVLDASGSMQRTDPKRLRDQGAKLFLRFLSEQDRVGIIQFDSDTKLIFDLAGVDVRRPELIDKAIENVSVDGRFTDLRKPIVAAFEMLTKKGRRDARRAVILLSDGVMDPHPTTGEKEAVTQLVFDEDLPRYKKQKITLYTLALSEEADRTLLDKLAKETNGLHWYAPDVKTIHTKFSDLFLALKMPQIVTMDGEGFEIDPSINEATFYITRKEGANDVTINDPFGETLDSLQLPLGVRWFRGEYFDVVTVKKPKAGRWTVSGIEDPEGFATLLTDLKLQIMWPEGALSVGDSVLVRARLTEKGEELSQEGMKEISFYTYKVVNTKSGQLVGKGSLLDTGEDGDQDKDDNIYSAIIPPLPEGDYKALVGVTSPTFTRQQQIPFSIGGTPIEIELEPEDELLKSPERIRVKLGLKAQELRKAKLRVVGKPVNDDKAYAMPHEEDKNNAGEYTALTSALPPGQYEIYATISGLDRRKKRFEAQSARVEYTREGDPDVEVVEVGEEKDEEGDLLWGIIFSVLALLWVSGLSGFAFLKLKKAPKGVKPVKAYKVPDELQARIEVIRERVSEGRREPNEADTAMRDLKPIPKVASSASESSEEADADDAAPEEAAEGAAEGEEGSAEAEEGAEATEAAAEEGEGAANGEAPAETSEGAEAADAEAAESGEDEAAAEGDDGGEEETKQEAPTGD